MTDEIKVAILPAEKDAETQGEPFEYYGSFVRTWVKYFENNRPSTIYNDVIQELDVELFELYNRSKRRKWLPDLKKTIAKAHARASDLAYFAVQHKPRKDSDNFSDLLLELRDAMEILKTYCLDEE